jgi:hypothetical protein
VFGFQASNEQARLRSEHAVVAPLSQLQTPARVTLAQRIRLAAALQLFARELAECGEHLVANTAVNIIGLFKQTALDKRRQAIEQRQLIVLGIENNRHGRIERAAAGKYRQASEDALLGRFEQVIAPGDRAT